MKNPASAGKRSGHGVTGMTDDDDTRDRKNRKPTLLQLMRSQARDARRTRILRAKGEIALREIDQPDAAPGLVSRMRRKDEVPRGTTFDLELGRLERDGVLAQIERTSDDVARDREARAIVQAIADRLRAALAPVSYAMPGTQPSDYPQHPRDYLPLRMPLKEIEALHRALTRPQWETILRDAIEGSVMIRYENRLREANTKARQAQLMQYAALSPDEVRELRASGVQPLDDYALPERRGRTGAEILGTLRSLAPQVIGAVPAWLTGRMVDELIAHRGSGPVAGAAGGGRPRLRCGWSAARGARTNSGTCCARNCSGGASGSNVMRARASAPRRACERCPRPCALHRDRTHRRTPTNR